jgi:hypothetical protein
VLRFFTVLTFFLLEIPRNRKLRKRKSMFCVYTAHCVRSYKFLNRVYNGVGRGVGGI